MMDNIFRDCAYRFPKEDVAAALAWKEDVTDINQPNVHNIKDILHVEVVALLCERDKLQDKLTTLLEAAEAFEAYARTVKFADPGEQLRTDLRAAVKKAREGL